MISGSTGLRGLSNPNNCQQTTWARRSLTIDLFVTGYEQIWARDPDTPSQRTKIGSINTDYSCVAAGLCNSMYARWPLPICRRQARLARGDVGCPPKLKLNLKLKMELRAMLFLRRGVRVCTNGAGLKFEDHSVADCYEMKCFW